MAEERILKLDNAMEDVKASMASLEMRLTSVEKSLADAKDHLQRIPSWWRLFGAAAAASIVVLILCTIIAFAFIIPLEGDMR